MMINTIVRTSLSRHNTNSLLNPTTQRFTYNSGPLNRILRHNLINGRIMTLGSGPHTTTRNINLNINSTNRICTPIIGRRHTTIKLFRGIRTTRRHYFSTTTKTWGNSSITPIRIRVSTLRRLRVTGKLTRVSSLRRDSTPLHTLTIRMPLTSNLRTNRRNTRRRMGRASLGMRNRQLVNTNRGTLNHRRRFNRNSINNRQNVLSRNSRHANRHKRNHTRHLQRSSTTSSLWMTRTSTLPHLRLTFKRKFRHNTSNLNTMHTLISKGSRRHHKRQLGRSTSTKRTMRRGRRLRRRKHTTSSPSVGPNRPLRGKRVNGLRRHRHRHSSGHRHRQSNNRQSNSNRTKRRCFAGKVRGSSPRTFKRKTRLSFFN